MTQEAQTAGKYPSPLMGWITVAVLFVLYILSLTDRYIIALLVAPIKQDLGLTDFQFGLLTGPAFAFFYSACAIPLGWLLDRYGRRLVLYFSVTIWSIAATFCGFVQGFASLAAARAVLGAGEAGFSTGAYSIIGDSFPPQRLSTAMSVFVMGGVMGAGIVFLIGGPLVGALTEGGGLEWPFMAGLEPWRQAFILTGIPGIFLALLIFLFRETRQAPAANAPNASLGYGEAVAFIAKNWRFYFSAFIGISVVYAATIGLQMWSPAYFERVHGWDKNSIGIYMGVAQILAALSLPLHGWIADLLFKRGMKSAHLAWCTLNAALGAVVGIAAYLMADPMLSVIMFGLYMVTGMAAAGLGPALVQLATPAHLRGRISALFVLCTGLISMGLGPSLVGFVTDYVMRDEAKVGFSMILSLCVLLPLAVIVLSIGRSRLEALIDANMPKPA